MHLHLMRKLMLLFLLMTSAMAATAQAQPETWTRRFYFELDRYTIRYELRSNRAVMDSTIHKLRTLLADTTVTNLRLDITSSSSLEASDAYNSRLSANRTAAFLSELRKEVVIPFHILFVHDNVFDWDQLYELTAASQCPKREKALDIIRSVPTVIPNKMVDNQRKLRLQELAGGATYRYMMNNLFPDMRNTSVVISYTKAPAAPAAPEPEIVINNEPITQPVEVQHLQPVVDYHNPVFAVKTNMLYDVGMTPNVGIEFYIAPNVSINANWAYAWWNKDRTSFYWRAYGGDLEARYYFRRWPTRKLRLDHAFSGHHIGLYGLLATYDYEFGNNGQQGAKWNYGGGIAYGYSLPITQHLNIDFSLGLGCLYGDYYKYEPSAVKNDDYYWLSTNRRKYWGPTKAEVSLVWVLGR